MGFARKRNSFANWRTQSSLGLADKSKLQVGDTVIFGNEPQVITLIEKGGAIGEKILSDKYILSNAILFTYDKLKQHQS